MRPSNQPRNLTYPANKNAELHTQPELCVAAAFHMQCMDGSSASMTRFADGSILTGHGLAS